MNILLTLGWIPINQCKR